MKNKFLTILLILSMLVNCLPMSFAFAEGNETETIVEKIEPTNDMLLLNVLGILNDSALEKAGEVVKRGDYAEIAVKFANVMLERTNVAYADLDGEAANYAATAVANGFMDDGMVGKFNSEKPITGIEVAMTLVTSFGFLDYAKSLGGYDKAAAKTGLCDGKQGLKEMTYIQLSNILVKALSKKAKSFFNNKTSDKIYLEEKLGYQVFQGKVTATSVAGINGNSRASAGKVSINGTMYDTELDMDEYLGTSIKFLIKLEDQNNDAKLVYVYPDVKREDLTIYSRDLISFDGEKYRYRDGNRVKNQKVAGAKTIIYNGVQRHTYMNDDLVPNHGWVRLVDSDNDGTRDLIFVYEYTVMIASAVDSKAMKINDINTNALVLDYSQAQTLKVIRNGRNVPVEDIRANEVISIFESENGENVTIYISSDKASGIITYVERDDDYRISIAGETFVVNEDYFNNCTTDAGKVLISKNVEAYLDSFGELVYIVYTESNAELGYLVKAKSYENEYGVIELCFTVFTGEKDFAKLYSTGEKIYIDGRRYKNEAALKMLNEDKGVGNESDIVKPQLIQYTLNEEGKIVTIDTAYNNQPAINALSTATEKTAARSEFARRQPTEYESKDSMRILYSSYIAPSEAEGTNGLRASRDAAEALGFGRSITAMRARPGARVFVVPTASSSNADNPKYYQVRDFYYFVDAEYKVEGYSFGDNIAADAIVTYAETAATGSKNFTSFKSFCITRIHKVWDEEESEIVTRIDFAGEYGGRSFFYAKEDAHWKTVQAYGDSNYYVPRELGVGDIFVADVDINGVITNIALVYDADIDEAVIEQQKNLYDPSEMITANAWTAEVANDYVNKITPENPVEQFTASSRFYSKMYNNMAPMHRKKADAVESHWWFFDVYEYDKKTNMAKTAFEDLRTYTGDKSAIEFNIEELNYSLSTVIYIDKTDGRITVTGGDSTGAGVSYDMIRDYKTYGNDYTRIIIGKESGAYKRQMYIIRDYTAH